MGALIIYTGASQTFLFDAPFVTKSNFNSLPNKLIEH